MGNWEVSYGYTDSGTVDFTLEVIAKSPEEAKDLAERTAAEENYISEFEVYAESVDGPDEDGVYVVDGYYDEEYEDESWIEVVADSEGEAIKIAEEELGSVDLTYIVAYEMED